MDTDTKTLVDAKLAEYDILFSSEYTGETVRDYNWECDSYRVKFATRGKSPFVTDYFMGLGNRKVAKSMSVKRNPFTVNTIAWEDWNKAYLIPVKPCATDIFQTI